MLQQIRDKTQGIISKILVGLLIAVFALWGLDTIVGNFLVSTPKLTVNGDEILSQEIDSVTQQKAQEVIAQLGENPDLSLLDETLLREAAVNELIQRTLLQQSAQSSGMGISPAAIDVRIAQNQDFQVDGVFNAERANLVLQGAGYTPSGYRSVLAQDLLLNQQLAAYTATGLSTPDQLAKLASLVHQKRTLRYLTVTAGTFTDAVTVSEEEITNYYDQNQADFQQEELVNIEYIELSKESLFAEVSVTEEQLQSAYQQEVAEYQAQTERRASHILWEATADEGLAAARTEAGAVKARLDAGEDFAALAAEFSDDTGSAQGGGDVGFTTGDSFVAPFEEALRSLAVDQVSEPVQTEFGIHLIKLTEVSETAIESFEMRRAALERDLKQKEVDTLYITRVEDLKNLAFESPDLEAPASRLNLVKQTSGLFGRNGGTGIAAEAAVQEAAFATEVMEDGLNSEVFTLGDRSVVLRVIDHQPAQIKALDVVRGEVEVAVRLDKAKTQAQALGESFINGMKSGDNIDGLLAAQNLTWAQTESIERVTPTVNPEIIDRAFIMPRPAEGGTEVSGFSLSSGDYVVIELQGVVDGTPADLREGEEQNMRNFLSQQAGSNDISGYILSLEARADIEGRESQLQVQDPLL